VNRNDCALDFVVVRQGWIERNRPVGAGLVTIINVGLLGTVPPRLQGPAIIEPAGTAGLCADR
jgi:hypothetical protein